MSYTEDALVEQPTIKLFSELDWSTLECWDKAFETESSQIQDQAQPCKRDTEEMDNNRTDIFPLFKLAWITVSR